MPMRTVETEVGLKGILLVADTASRLERLEGGEGAGSICRLADGREHLLDAYHLHPGEHVVFALPVNSNRKDTSSLRRGYGRALSRSSDDGEVTRAEANFEQCHDSAAEIGYRIPVLSTVARAPAVSKLAGMDSTHQQTAAMWWKRASSTNFSRRRDAVGVHWFTCSISRRRPTPKSRCSGASFSSPVGATASSVTWRLKLTQCRCLPEQF